MVFRPDRIQHPGYHSLDKFSEQYCISHFRFRKQCLQELIGNLDDNQLQFNGLLPSRLPKYIYFDNGSKGKGDLLFLYYIQKLSTKSLLINNHNFLGREYSYCSRAFTSMGAWIYNTWGWRILGDQQLKEYWIPKFQKFNQHYCQKYFSVFNSPIPRRCENIAFVYDCNHKRICVPVDRDLNNHTYSGYEKCNGLKGGASIAPNGMTMHYAGLYSTNHADPFVQTHSQINNVVAEGQIGNPRQLYGYEYKAYFPRSHFVPAFTNRTGKLQEWQEIENERMKIILCTLEWTFGRNIQFFGLSDHYMNLKIMESPVAHIITNTFLLNNLLICCHGCNSNDYFDISPDSLTAYLRYEI